jgi:hypothetical protein
VTRLFLAVLLLAPAGAKDISISSPAKSEPVKFAVARLGEATRSAAGKAKIVIRVSGASPAVRAGGFEILKSGPGIRVLARDEAGAMYGTLELAEQVRAGGLAGVRPGVANSRFPFRAIKFNLPWSSYRVDPALQLHHDTVRDLRFWREFLDMMAENRFNALTLWALHPWPYMIRATNFPKACSFDDRELAEWQAFWHKLFAMAKARGIETYMVNWNTFVSTGYRDAYDKNAVIDGPNYFGPSNTTDDVRRYNRESVTQVLNEYPDLAGIGITLGERMDEMDVYKQVEWVEDVYFRGIKAAKRPAKFIYRAALKNNDPAFVRKSIENSGLPAPIWVELKFNWSHAYSTTTLVHAHGYGTGEAYWNPPPKNHKMTWMMRNEDFFMLRWGQADFIREHLEKNGGDYAGGYFVGSECYIPAKEYFHRPDSPHLTWRYAFEKQWLYYKQWGRLLYDPKTPDSVFEAEFDRRYGGGVGKPLLRAYSLAGRMPLRLASLYFSTWDFSLYSEGFLAPAGEKGDPSPFISVDDLIERKTLDPNYVSVKDYVKTTAAGGKFDDARVTPPRLADDLDKDGKATLELLRSIPAGPATLQCEIDDARAWAWLSVYFADKLRGAVAVASWRATRNEAEQTKAVSALEQAARSWEEVVRITQAHFAGQPPLIHLQRLKQRTFSWENYREDVQRDIQIARGR